MTWIVMIGNKQDRLCGSRREARDHAHWLRHHPAVQDRCHLEGSNRVRVVPHVQDTSKLAKAITRLGDVNQSLKGIAKTLEVEDANLKPLEDSIGDIKLTLLDLYQIHRKL